MAKQSSKYDRAAYERTLRWRAKYPEKWKAVCARYYRKNKASRQKANKAQYQKNRLERIARQKAYYRKNRAAVLRKSKARYQRIRGSK